MAWIWQLYFAILAISKWILCFSLGKFCKDKYQSIVLSRLFFIADRHLPPCENKHVYPSIIIIPLFSARIKIFQKINGDKDNASLHTKLPRALRANRRRCHSKIGGWHRRFFVYYTTAALRYEYPPPQKSVKTPSDSFFYRQLLTIHLN